MKNTTKWLIASGIGVAAGAAIYAFLRNKRENANELNEYEDEMYLDFSAASKISYEDAEKKATEFAKGMLGIDAAVVSASDKKALVVNIAGQSHYCFLFGAVSENLSLNSETLLIYVDSVTGEVFESDKIG